MSKRGHREKLPSPDLRVWHDFRIFKWNQAFRIEERFEIRTCEFTFRPTELPVNVCFHSLPRV
jgi:hypothetical protein